MRLCHMQDFWSNDHLHPQQDNYSGGEHLDYQGEPPSTPVSAKQGSMEWLEGVQVLFT